MKLSSTSSYETSNTLDTKQQKVAESKKNIENQKVVKPTYEEFLKEQGTTEEELNELGFAYSFKLVYSLYDHMDNVERYKEELTDPRNDQFGTDFFQRLSNRHIRSINYMLELLDFEEKTIKENIFLHIIDYTNISLDEFDELDDLEERKADIALGLRLKYNSLLDI